MKFILDNTGQLCNKLWSIVNPIIKYGEKNETLVFICWDNDFRHFKNLLNESNFYFPFKFLNSKNKAHNRFIRAIQILIKNKHYDLSKIFPAKFIYGWENKREINDGAQHSELKKIFEPDILFEIKNLFQINRNRCDIIIGIHIRRGDYKSWQNGKYYYDFQDYVEILTRLSGIFKGKKVKFFIASDEKIDDETFKGIDYFTSEGAVIEDLYSLSLCDYIVGPPSSFSQWAAFYNEVPYCCIKQKNQLDFKFRQIKKLENIEDL